MILRMIFINNEILKFGVQICESRPNVSVAVDFLLSTYNMKQNTDQPLNLHTICSLICNKNGKMAFLTTNTYERGIYYGYSVRRT